MRMSCNGCRALRKGCSVDCPLKPCLQWIKSPESQANATVFLAKFYGRAGLLNLINAASPHLRPEIFRSLLHEACGRIINPVHGSVGLMRSGDWQRCQEAVAAVLEGAPIKIEAHVSDSGDHEEYSSIIPSLRGSHHLSREAVSGQHRGKTPRRLKRSRPSQADDYYSFMSEPQEKFTITGWKEYCNDDDEEEEELKICWAPSHDDPLSVGDIRPGRVVKPEPGFTGLDLTLGPN